MNYCGKVLKWTLFKNMPTNKRQVKEIYQNKKILIDVPWMNFWIRCHAKKSTKYHNGMKTRNIGLLCNVGEGNSNSQVGRVLKVTIFYKLDKYRHNSIFLPINV